MDSHPEPEPEPDHARIQQARPEPTPVHVEEQPYSNFADDPLTRLWRNADRPTGAEAVEALRARRKASQLSTADVGRRRVRRET